MAFEKVYDLTLKENDWEFKVKVIDTNLNNDVSIDIDVKLKLLNANIKKNINMYDR